jgi:phenylalanyl-tRNA synthetase beta chain
MPVVAISTARLRGLLGTKATGEELAEAVDSLGCDLEELVTVDLYSCPSCRLIMDRLPREDPPVVCEVCGHEAAEVFEKIGTDEVVRLDLLPARPDLFDCAGLARALDGYLGFHTGLPAYPIEDGEVEVTVDPSVLAVRPEIALVEIDLPPLTQSHLADAFHLQENLHWAMGRGRKKASIGVYDLSTITGEITYTAESPDFRFVPLGMPDREMTLAEILTDHPKGRAYRGLLDGHEQYPVLIDSAGQVLSMPPIINSEETRLRPGSTKILIDVTGHDRKVVEDTLALTLTSIYQVEGRIRSVRIHRPGEELVTPNLTPFKRTLSPERAEKLIGVEIPEDEMIGLLRRMRLDVTGKNDKGEFEVRIPRYRVDVKHEVDLIEDVAIAYGYQNLPSPLVPTMTVGQEHPYTAIGRKVRSTLCGLGFIEVLNFVLTNREEHLTRMRLPDDVGQAVLLNPISVNQEIVRTNLLSGLMATFALNRTREMPQPIFEVGEVVRATAEDSTQGFRLAIGEMSRKADYGRIRAVVDSVCRELSLPVEVLAAADHELKPVFLDGRVAELRSGGEIFGIMGVVRPEVITAWSLDHPVVLAELDADKMLALLA